MKHFSIEDKLSDLIEWDISRGEYKYTVSGVYPSGNLIKEALDEIQKLQSELDRVREAAHFDSGCV